MYRLVHYLTSLFVIIFILNVRNISFSEESEIYEILSVIQKDLKTLEKAVYSGDSFSSTQSSGSNSSLRIPTALTEIIRSTPIDFKA